MGRSRRYGERKGRLGRGSVAAEPRYGRALISGEPAFSSDMRRICEKIDGRWRWGNRPGSGAGGRPLYHRISPRASPFGRKNFSKILCSYLLTFS